MRKAEAQPTLSQNKPVPAPQPDAESRPWSGPRQHTEKQIPQNKEFHVPSPTPANKTKTKTKTKEGEKENRNLVLSEVNQFSNSHLF